VTGSGIALAQSADNDTTVVHSHTLYGISDRTDPSLPFCEQNASSEQNAAVGQSNSATISGSAFTDVAQSNAAQISQTSTNQNTCNITVYVWSFNWT
jgi:hypothetical protein